MVEGQLLHSEADRERSNPRSLSEPLHRLGRRAALARSLRNRLPERSRQVVAFYVPLDVAWLDGGEPTALSTFLVTVATLCSIAAHRGLNCRTVVSEKLSVIPG